MELKFFKKEIHERWRKRKLPFGPTRAWHTFLVIALVIVLASGIFSWYLYNQIKHDEAFQGGETNTKAQNLLQHAKLDAVLKKFDEKGVVFTELQVVKPEISDPSI